MTGAMGKLIDRAIGLQLRFARRQKMMLREDMAQTCSLPIKQIERYEKGDDRIPQEILLQFAKLLDQDVSWFYQQDQAPGAITDDDYVECLHLLARLRDLER